MFKLKHTKRHKRQRFALGACDHMIENKSCGWVNCFAVSVKCRWSGGASDLVAMPAVKNEGCPCALTDSDEMDGYSRFAVDYAVHSIRMLIRPLKWERIFQFGLLSLLAVRWKRHPLRRAAKLSQRRHMSHPLDQFRILNVGHPFNVSYQS